MLSIKALPRHFKNALNCSKEQIQLRSNDFFMEIKVHGNWEIFPCANKNIVYAFIYYLLISFYKDLYQIVLKKLSLTLSIKLSRIFLHAKITYIFLIAMTIRKANIFLMKFLLDSSLQSWKITEDNRRGSGLENTTQ